MVKELKTWRKNRILKKIVGSRLVGEAKPDEYERKAIAESEKYGKLEFTPL